MGKATAGTGSTLGGTGGEIDHTHTATLANTAHDVTLTGHLHTASWPSHAHSLPTTWDWSWQCAEPPADPGTCLGQPWAPWAPSIAVNGVGASDAANTNDPDVTITSTSAGTQGITTNSANPPFQSVNFAMTLAGDDADVETGTIVAWGGSTAPPGWLIANGAVINSGSFGELWGLNGNTYGDGGDGAGPLFTLPDLRQRIPLGKAAAGTGATLGSTGGTIDHAPSFTTAGHTHNFDPPARGHTWDFPSVSHTVSTSPSWVETQTAIPDSVLRYFSWVPAGSTSSDGAAGSIGGSTDDPAPTTTGAPISVSNTTSPVNPPFATVNFIIAVDLLDPTTPVLQSPADLSIVTSLPTLTAAYIDPAPGTWGIVQFQLCSDAACSSVVQSGSSASNLVSGANGTWIPGALTFGTYYWRARNVDGAANLSAWSATWRFTYDNAPNQATLVSPANGGWVTSTQPTLTANFSDPDAGDSGTLTFEICQGNPADPWSANCATGYQTGTSLSGIPWSGGSGAWAPPTPLAEGATRSWRARGTDTIGVSGAWSLVRSFSVDTIAPTLPSNLRTTSRRPTQIAVAWDASTDGGSGGVTYNVQTSVDGAAYGTTCASIAVLTCTRSGLVHPDQVVFRVQAVDLAGNFSAWVYLNDQTPETYYLRTTLNSGILTNAANRLASLPPAGANNNTTSVLFQITGPIGWYIYRPAIASSTVNVAAEPADNPYVATGTGWVVDDYASKVADGSPLYVRVRHQASGGASGVGNLQCRMWKVTTDGAGNITGSSFLGKQMSVDSVTQLPVDIIDGSTHDLDCDLTGLGTQTTFTANEALYLELWLNATGLPGANRTLSIHAEGANSYIGAPTPGAMPDPPTALTPVASATVLNAPVLGATYSHPSATAGVLEFEVYSDVGCAVLVSSGSTTTVANNTPATFTTSGTQPASTYYWRVRGVDQYGRAGPWNAGGCRAVITDSPPTQPTNSSPSNGATLGTVAGTFAPTLQSSAFADPNGGDTHGASQWQVRTPSGSYVSPIADSGTTAVSLTSWTVSPALAAGATYWWRVRHRDSYGEWSAWSAETWFTISNPPAISIAIPTGLTAALSPLPFPNSDSTAQSTIQVDTNNVTGYSLTATDSSDTAGMTRIPATDTLDDWTGTDVTPSVWAAATSGANGYFGVTVLSASGGRLAKWGSGSTTETDFATNRYFGLQTSARTLHSTSVYSGSTASVVVAYRADPSASSEAGGYSTSITFTATALP